MVEPTRKLDPIFLFGMARNTGRVEENEVGDLRRLTRPTKTRKRTIIRIMTKTPKMSIKKMRTLKTMVKRIPQETLSRMEFPKNWSHH